MANIDELKREAEEAKERLKRDTEEVREILRKIAIEVGGLGKTKAEEAMQQAERRVGETAQRVATRIEKAIARMAELSIEAGSVATKELDFSDFTNVEIGHAFKAEIICSDSHSVAIMTSEQLLDHINVTKSGNTLKISLNPLSFHIRPTLEAKITMPTLNKLRLADATKGIVRGFSSQEDFALNLSGSSTLDIDMEAGEAKLEVSGASKISGYMKVGDAEITLSGASKAELTGSANNVTLNAWGASWLDLAGFVLNDMDVNLKGASQATVNLNGKLDLDLNGCSRLCYAGSPTMRNVNVSGASTLSQRK